MTPTTRYSIASAAVGGALNQIEALINRGVTFEIQLDPSHQRDVSTIRMLRIMKRQTEDNRSALQAARDAWAARHICTLIGLADAKMRWTLSDTGTTMRFEKIT